MRDLSSAQLAALESGSFTLVAAVCLWRSTQTMATGFIRWTDSPHGLTLTHTDPWQPSVMQTVTYSADANLLAGIEPPKPQNEASRDVFGLRWYDQNGAYERSFANLGHVGVRCHVAARAYAGDETIDSVFFVGTSLSFASSFEEDGRIAMMTFGSPLNKFDADYSMTTSEADQAERDADDDCFKHAHKAKDFEWGAPPGGWRR